MRGILAAAALALMAGAGVAQELVPGARVVIRTDTDLPGRDIGTVFDTTQQGCQLACTTNSECRAFTFNSLNNRCFIKSEAGRPSGFGGAISGVVLSGADGALAAARRAEATFLTDADMAAARAQVEGLAGDDTAGAVLVSDSPEDWAAWSASLLARAEPQADAALSAAVNAWLRAAGPQQQRAALTAIATAAEAAGRGDDTVRALRLAQAVAPNDATAALLADAAGKFGFRITGTDVQSDSARPRICATFSGDLATGTDLAPFVQVPDGLMVDRDGPRQICVEGVSHGQRYALTFRSGLPAADGQVLAAEVRQEHYVRDRAPAARFAGRGYVLPRTGSATVPVQTVNTDRLELSLYHVADRNLLRAMQDSFFAAPVDAWREAEMDGTIGNRVWQGEGAVAMEANRDMTTRLPLDQAIWGLPAGIYALKAAVPGADPYEMPAAWQWFVISDLGISTFLGTDGLDVIVRSLNTTDAKAGVEVSLISAANEVLAVAVTDEGGRASFSPGLVRGTGGSTPALVTVREGDADLAFLSLTDAEFDLSDRGVAGREAAGPVDMFLTTDRGAYRAGEVVHVTALARDDSGAVEGLPLTAILLRPDGVEQSRQLVPDAGAGGHVFDLPVAANAQRGTWRLEMRADPEAPPLVATSFLVEDFLPERIDFDMTLPDLRLNGSSDLGIDARWLFGAPGADLAVEGEVLLRAAEGLAGYEGYSFGLHDDPFNGAMESLAPVRTDASGRATVALNLPFVEAATRPLEARITARLSEGSGRPVERELTRPVAPDAPLIGLRPMFEGVLPEGGEARFSVLSLDAGGDPTPAEARWELTRIETEYQWYQQYGNWNWEPFTTRTRVDGGEIAIDGTAQIAAPVRWGEYELHVGTSEAASSVTFSAGWYAAGDASTTPDRLEMSLDKASYAPGDEAVLRIASRSEGTALVSVLTNRVLSTQAVKVAEGETRVPLEVTAEWGAGAYVTASVLRPMDAAAGRGPTRALGIAHAAIDPGPRHLDVAIDTAPEADPRGKMDIAVRVAAPEGELVHVTIAAVDQGILNLTRFAAPDPAGHFFGQRKLGVGIRDMYGRLIDGLNGAEGQVRSGGDASAEMGLQAPPPTEAPVTLFSGPLVVGTDGTARASFDLPAFNGSVKVMAVAWSQSGVGQAQADVLVRDPVVVTASLPRFLAPGDESRLLLDVTHASGPAGRMEMEVDGAALAPFDLAEGGTQRIEVPVTAGAERIEVALTTPDGKRVTKTLALPVMANDPQVSRTTRLELAPGEVFTFDDNAYSGLTDASATLAIGPIARLNAPGLLAALHRYPYGCTEQVTSRALPLIYYDQVAQAMRLEGADDIRARIEQAVTEVLGNQGGEGGFGLWSAGSGDLWLDAYVTDFLSRAKAQGIAVPDPAFRRALDNLRNQVNYAADFDERTNGGGTGLAYALMVLAREGAAAVGDLRYYADVKGADFATPLAQAQLGAALASYGDKARSDAMFALASDRLARADDEGQVWRADYGTQRRDAAAVLTLAVEAGAEIDREPLLARTAQPGQLSTQEAAWTLLASHALVDAAPSGVTIDGAAVDGPLVRMRAPGDAPSQIRNDGDAPVALTLTAYGADRTAPAGGNGYAIARSYFTLDGSPVDPSSVAAGTRLVTVLDVTPFGPGEARLMVTDPLPAGFEIDNPNLITAGDTGALDWLRAETSVTHSEFRQDRFLTAIDRQDASPFRLAYIVRAISPGSFHHPAASVEDMYRPDYRAQTGSGRVTVTP
ncbi:alpha-2-macroglobulin family protein [Cereibacter sp. SYSU M97828]|nr:alpha-2-macroglobulin family protein [Cereibacter flavus]